jgi:acyl-CoA reductase-like NAD-dependent aldehyde dehydrogenase
VHNIQIECATSLFRGVPLRGEVEGVEAFARALERELRARRDELVELMRAECGFVAADASEVLQGAFSILAGFRSRQAEVSAIPASAPGRQMALATAPWGKVALLLPQNSFLYLAATCLIHALDAGNRVVLRAPTRCGATAEVLRQAIWNAGPPGERVVISSSPAPLLIEAFLASTGPGLLHYFGGSERVPELLAHCFAHGKGCIADGQGNTWVYVGERADSGRAAATLTSGAVRYNGQTCTSVNGAWIHPSRYDEVLAELTLRFCSLRVCDHADDAEVGPLSDERHAVHGLRQALESGGTIVAGGARQGRLLHPTLVESPDLASSIVRDGVFGPVLWVRSGGEKEFWEAWEGNRFPLCAGVLGSERTAREWAHLPGLARLVVDGDPSLEDPLGPWGGYPASGNATVTGWWEKYRRVVQIDSPAIRPPG